MSNQHPNANGTMKPLNRLDELLADRAVQGLDASEQSELTALLAAAGKAEDSTLDLAAAACDRGMYPIDDPIPAALLATLHREGDAWCAGVAAGHKHVAGRIQPIPRGPGRGNAVRTPFKRFTREWGGWLAAAACLTFGVYAYSSRTTPASTPFEANTTLHAGVLPHSIAGPIEDMAMSLHQRAADRIDRWFNTGSKFKVVPLGAATPDASADVAVGQVMWNIEEGNGVLKISRIDDGKVTPGGSRTFRLSVFDPEGNPVAIETAAVTVLPGQKDVVVPIDGNIGLHKAAAFVVSVCSAGPMGSTQSEGLLGLSNFQNIMAEPR